MRRSMRSLALVAAVVCVETAAPWRASADSDPGCKLKDKQTGICIINAPAPPRSAPSPRPQPTPGAGGHPAPAPAAPVCVGDDGTGIPCKNSYGSWDADTQCYVLLKEPQPPKSDPTWADHTAGAIYSCTAVGHGAYAPETVELWLAAPPAAAPPVDFLALATQAEKTLVFNQPTTGRYPSGRLQNGTAYTVVGIPTWFWSDATAWKPLSARAHNGANTLNLGTG